ncbi:FliH/SctL family protein [Paenibacillus riograndensis]|uniref:Flagellar biosynthesis protein n=2 Tax=Paenibacillus riograndensis TaxID=483937 RepID=A0A132TN15_9BACL|nr:FliH/SctL family protein [Paenibacillus riograndensis]KWX72573.1 flagellar biosynthesis protein [Paenibacillus riograndensis]KWX85181.1 flagellar biosynthesis protein [Paenibacillus riograndensis]CQR56478.1 flagellar assembly protein FliH [Paenibacillus riograndensis SBR5]
MSRLIKHSQYVPVDVLKRLEQARQYAGLTEESIASDEAAGEVHIQDSAREEAEQARKQMLKDAQEFAEGQVRDAAQEAENIVESARTEAEEWWRQRREQDEHLVEAVKSEAYQQGYQEGQAQAELEMSRKMAEMMEEARQVLQEAYRAKEVIIQEAEPFLVELSCSIAEKIVDKQLTVEPQFAMDLIRKNLARKREQGLISLCVSPAQFSFVNAAREELAMAVDSQAELQILPDSTVKDHGCVIRSSFGSIDARIDTQLAEIKKELIRIALDTDENRNGEDDA